MLAVSQKTYYTSTRLNFVFSQRVVKVYLGISERIGTKTFRRVNIWSSTLVQYLFRPFTQLDWDMSMESESFTKYTSGFSLQDQDYRRW